MERVYRSSAADAARVADVILAENADEATLSVLKEVLALAMDASRSDNAAIRNWAIEAVDLALDEYARPNGTFEEYDRASWIGPDEMWRTIPWGTAFRANELLDVYQAFKDDLSPGQRARWEEVLRNSAAWVRGNPVVGSVVFNCAIDLCRFLWRAGSEFGDAGAVEWALRSGRERVRRDVDDDGWIHGENKGVSGFYQLLGAELLAEFAWQSRDPELVEAADRAATVILNFAAPDLLWPGNFGTRSDFLGPVRPRLIVLAAALGNKAAAAAIRANRVFKASVSDEIWAAALETGADPVVPVRVAEFPPVDATVVREGPWQAWFAG
ncbi:MAG: hypothetical protein SFU53_15005, partial [Terrimicrobiaceae bacterium]|nr:hypothetical protein [Terrimicrobiaceae bacterium]